MSPTQGQAVIIGVTFAPAISKNLKAFLYGWLPLSDASGIFFANDLSDAFGMMPLHHFIAHWEERDFVK